MALGKGYETEAIAQTKATVKSCAAQLRMQSITLREYNQRLDGILADAGLRPSSEREVGGVDQPSDPSLQGALSEAVENFERELGKLDQAIDFINSEMLG